MPTAPAAIGRSKGLMSNLRNLNMTTITSAAKPTAAAVGGVLVGSLAQGFMEHKGWKLPWNLDIRLVGGVAFLVGGAMTRSKYADYYLAAGAGLLVAVLVDASDGIVNKVETWGAKLADWLTMKPAAGAPAAAGYEDVGSIAGKRRRLQHLEKRIDRLQGRAEKVKDKLGIGDQPAAQQSAGRGRRMPRQIPQGADRGAGQTVTIPAGQYRHLLAQAGY